MLMLDQEIQKENILIEEFTLFKYLSCLINDGDVTLALRGLRKLTTRLFIQKSVWDDWQEKPKHYIIGIDTHDVYI